jgi:hypothetical protein
MATKQQLHDLIERLPESDVAPRLTEFWPGCLPIRFG